MYTVFLNTVIFNSMFIAISTKTFSPTPVFPNVLANEVILIKMSKTCRHFSNIENTPLSIILQSESSLNFNGRKIMSFPPQTEVLAIVTDNKQDSN